ncbi:cardiolipin synthase (CMP-forming) [Diutina catenulata]
MIRVALQQGRPWSANLAFVRGLASSRAPRPRQTGTPGKTIEIPTAQEWRGGLCTVPNVLTMTRIATAPVVGYFIVKGQTDWAAGLFTYSCITDLVDGWIARRFNQKSVVGSIIDPLADKLLMTVCTLSLAYTSAIPGLVATAIIGRDVMLSFMAFYYRYKSLPHKSVKEFLDIQGTPTITVLPNMLGKVNTALQMFYIGGLVIKPVLQPFVDLTMAFDVYGVVVALTTVASGCSYVFGKHAFKYIKPKQN